MVPFSLSSPFLNDPYADTSTHTNIGVQTSQTHMHTRAHTRAHTYKHTLIPTHSLTLTLTHS